MARARAPSLPGRTRSQKVRFLDHARLARVDDDELGAPCFGPADPHGGGWARRLGVVAPEQNAAGVIVVRLWRAHTVGVLRTRDPMPAADMVGVQDVGTAEGVGQALHARRRSRRWRCRQASHSRRPPPRAPYRALISRRREAVSAIASSHEMRTQPGSGSPLGRVRFMGYWRRSGE